MSTKILIAPFPAALRSGAVSAKHYPYWPELVTLLKANDHEIIQIGKQGEQRVAGADHFHVNWPYCELKELMEMCDTFISTDSWFPHFAHYHQLKPGVVLWGKSSPRIFGYPENENLFVSEANFREWQYKDWEDEPYDETVFVPARQVGWAVDRLVRKASVYV